MKTLWKIIKYCFGIFVLFLILYGLSVYLYCHFYANSPIYISGKPYLTHLECEQRIKPANKDDLVRILIIEGGGMHGLLPLHVLDYLEKKTGKPINELFDVMSGTSTGSIIITSLSIPGKDGRPKYNVKDVIEKYKTIGVKSLQDHWYQKAFTVNGLFGPRLTGSNIDEIYKENYGEDLRFDQLLGMLIVPAYDINTDKMTYFNSWETGCNNRPDYYVHEIISAATATPSIFPPVILRDIQNNYSCTYIDAGVDSNSSIIRILETTMKLYPNKQYVITLLRTGGNLLEEVSYKNAQHWGLVQWIMIGFVTSYVSQNTTEIRAAKLLAKVMPNNQLRLYIFNKTIPKEAKNSFDVSSEAIKIIDQVGTEEVEENKERLDELASILMHN